MYNCVYSTNLDITAATYNSCIRNGEDMHTQRDTLVTTALKTEYKDDDEDAKRFYRNQLAKHNN